MVHKPMKECMNLKRHQGHLCPNNNTWEKFCDTHAHNVNINRTKIAWNYT